VSKTVDPLPGALRERCLRIFLRKEFRRSAGARHGPRTHWVRHAGPLEIQERTARYSPERHEHVPREVCALEIRLHFKRPLKLLPGRERVVELREGLVEFALGRLHPAHQRVLSRIPSLSDSTFALA
jgi:hypothetical protein